MGISKNTKDKWLLFSDYEKSRIVRMSWEDRTSFNNITKQFLLSPNEIVRFMRTQLNDKDYKRWRLRMNTKGHLKHEKKLPKLLNRFKCSRQRLDGSTKGWK